MTGFTAVVLAGGQGTRLRPLTNDLPKPMLPVVNRPFLEHQLERLRAGGVTRVILALGYRPEPFVAHFRHGEDFGLEIEYAVEDRPMGTSGAVRALLPRLTETFLVVNGDCMASVDIAAMIAQHVERREYATLAVHRVEDPSRFGVVVTDGEGYVTQFIEKPPGPRFPAHTINSGVYILEPEMLRFVPEGQPSMFERDLFPAALRSGVQMTSFLWDGYFTDMGTAESYLKLNRDLLEGRVPPPGGRPLTPPPPNRAVIAPDAVVQGPVVLGDGVAIGGGARVVGPSVLGDGCVVETGASVVGSVLWRGVTIGAGAIVEGAILATDVTLRPGARVTPGSVVPSGETVATA